MAIPKHWQSTRLSEVLSECDDRCGTLSVPVLSVTKTRGLMLASERFGRVMHGKNLAAYRLARRGTLVADPMLLWDGSIGIQDVVDAGAVSPDYRVYCVSDQLDLEYLRNLIRSPSMIRRYQDGARGTNVRRNRITRDDFLAIPFERPPLPEQKKIAAILSSVDEVIAKTEAVIAQLQIVKKAMMEQLLTKGMPGRHTRFQTLDTEWRLGRIVPDIGEIPETWRLVHITDVARLESGHTPSRNHPEYWEGDIPWVSLHDSKNLDGPVIMDTAQTIGALGLANSSARMLPKGTVVFSRTATVGKCTVLGRDMSTSQDFANYVCGPTLDPRYLMHLMRNMQTEWKRLMAGSTHQTIYMPVFRDLQILLPPMDEQRQIAAIGDQFHGTIASEYKAVAELKHLKSALSSSLLSGELRVIPEVAK